jgi:uronate dehydrogenase
VSGPRILITGASGEVGQAVVRGLPDAGWTVRQLDRVPPIVALPAPHDAITGDCFDPKTLDAALPGCVAVVHLAAISGESTIEQIAASHVVGTAHVLEAMIRHDVNRLVVASSNHAVGFTRRADLVSADTPPRPDTYYGVGKVATEALASLATDRHGMATACLRIGTFRDEPVTARHLSTWLSPGDLVRLTDACLRAPDLTHAVVYGISANTRGWWDLTPGRALGYDPQDNAEDYAHRILADGEIIDLEATEHAFLGGSFVADSTTLRGAV